MSRKTLLDDAIAKAKADEDWQLVEWLRMARGGESAARWYTEKLRDAHRVERQLLNENAKLREFAKEACEMARSFYNLGGTFNDLDDLLCEASELGVEVDA